MQWFIEGILLFSTVLHFELFQVVQSRQAEERIRAVLAFPGGWLVEDEREEDVAMEVEGFSDQEREAELVALRRLLVPRTVTLLHSLLHSTGQHQQSVALADTVADEGHALYQAEGDKPGQPP